MNVTHEGDDVIEKVCLSDTHSVWVGIPYVGHVDVKMILL